MEYSKGVQCSVVLWLMGVVTGYGNGVWTQGMVIDMVMNVVTGCGDRCGHRMWVGVRSDIHR